MRRKAATLVALCLLVSLFTVPAYALDSEGATAEIEAAIVLPDLSDPAVIYPFDVIYDKDNAEIRKLYSLKPGENPAKIRVDSFKRDGFIFECAEILKQEITGIDRREHTEAYETESKKNDMASVMALLPETKDITTEDGLSGTLALDISSIKVEVSGYGSSSQTVTATRSYPNLSDADMSNIPKTIEDSGRTLNLSDVQWQTANTENVDDYAIADRYTATATYSGIVTGSYVKGYTVTANYTGEVSREDIASVRYTVIFIGTEIPKPTPAPTPEPTPTPPPTPALVITPAPESESDAEPDSKVPLWGYLLIPFTVLALIGGSAAGYIFMKRKEKKRNEKEIASEIPDNDYDNEYIDYDDYDDDDDDTEYPGLGT